MPESIRAEALSYINILDLTQMKDVSELNLDTGLTAIYRQLENELAQLNPGCNGCGTCCNFSDFDHVLYASGVEIDFIVRHAHVPDFAVSDNMCPFLKDNHCSIREFRMLGCRVFYCNPHYQEVSHEVYEKYYRMIKELYNKHAIPWKYQPFLNQLKEAPRKRSS